MLGGGSRKLNSIGSENLKKISVTRRGGGVYYSAIKEGTVQAFIF